MGIFSFIPTDWRITSKGLLRLELIIACVLTNLFSLGLTNFGFEEYEKQDGFLLSTIFLLFYIATFIFNLSNGAIKKGALILYTIALFVVRIIMSNLISSPFYSSMLL